MNLHMNRRLEVLAREIAAKKSFPVDQEENARFAAIGRSNQFKLASDSGVKSKGAANPAGREVAPNCRPAEAAPPIPSQPKAAAAPFKVGDRVRSLVDGVNIGATGFKAGDIGEVMRITETSVYARFSANALHWAFYELQLELIPQKEEAKPSAGEWLDCGEDMPDIPGGQYMFRRKYAHDRTYPGAVSLRSAIGPSQYATYQYLVRP